MNGTSPETIRRNERVTSDLDIYRAARAKIARYGDHATLHVAQRADELLAAGDGDWMSYRLLCSLSSARRKARPAA